MFVFVNNFRAFAVLAIAAAVVATTADAAIYRLATASVEIFSANSWGNGNASLGILLLQQFVDDEHNGAQYVTITGDLSGITPGSMLHGIHIHQSTANASTACSALGKHYNPLQTNHGAQNNSVQTRHVGDLGNVMSDCFGNARVSISDNIIQIGTDDHNLDVVGRSLAIHIGTDDLGLGGTNTSLVNGNSGSIMACGNIVLQEKVKATASATIYSGKSYGNPPRLGTVVFRQYAMINDDQTSYVTLSGNVALASISTSGASPHGFHIHENAANSSTGCSALGKHYNPLKTNHGSPDDDATARHVGDLGNVMADSEGTLSVALSDTVIQIGTGDAIFDVVGKSIAIHSGTDDLGRGGTNTSLANGNSGPIIACGNIVTIDL